jgi:hypothetical protein
LWSMNSIKAPRKLAFGKFRSFRTGPMIDDTIRIESNSSLKCLSAEVPIGTFQ